jgi:hypothetical protein
MGGDIRHRFLCCDYSGDKVCIVSADGKIEWQVEARHPQDCWLLPNGNVLFAYVGGAKEITPAKDVAWEYKAPGKGVECHAAQPLANGNVLVVECGTSRLIEVDRDGRIAKEIPARHRSRGQTAQPVSRRPEAPERPLPRRLQRRRQNRRTRRQWQSPARAKGPRRSA